jgi:hypothetical protein
MEKCGLRIFIAILWVFMLGAPVPAEDSTFEYPYYLIDSYNPEGDCWTGMDPNGIWPVRVVPSELLVGEPPAVNVSGVTIPSDHWIELRFRGQIVDAPGNDLFLCELDPMGEEALVFLTDGADQEYLLGLASVPNTGEHGPTVISFDLAGLSLPFAACAVRIVGLDLRGGSPGFDLAYIRARTSTNCRNTACNPSPPDGISNVPADAVLNWSSGASADRHIVHFGTSLDDVGPDAPAINYPAQPQDSNSFDPGGLELGRTYYWRIDEVNDTDTNYAWTGPVWKFTVADYQVVEDFESYNSFSLIHSWQQIDNAYIYLSMVIEPVHHCKQALAFSYYYDNLSYSEAKHSFDYPQDWASMGAKSLEIYFYGEDRNDPYVQMYFVIDDGHSEKIIPYDGDPNDVTKEAWQPWRIDVTKLDDVDFSHIISISIGFCTSASAPMESGYGFVYFDDIRLYSSRCIEENRPEADLDCDCSVGFKDLEEMADNWLDSGYQQMATAAPAAPRAWYKFDGNANDSAGNYHGLILDNPTFVPGIHGQAIKFDGHQDSVIVSNATSLLSQINAGITICFWAYGTNSSHHTDTLFCTNYIYNLYHPSIAIHLGCWKSPGRYMWDCGSPWSFDNQLCGDHRYKAEWTGRWNHWAFTKDFISGKMKIYLNGELLDSRTSVSSPLTGISSFEIGSGWYGGYDGLMDDFRIYDYALSQPEIAYIVTNGTGVLNVPLFSPADLFYDNTINFRDFAVLADHWLEENLYP